MGISVEDAVKELQARETVSCGLFTGDEASLCDLRRRDHIMIRCGFLQKKRH